MAHRVWVAGSIVALGCLIAAAAPAHAGCEIYYVIPGKPGVPVVINHHEARWTVVEGECGLDRPGHMPQTVIGGRFVGPLRGEIRPTRYYPTGAQKPVQGRDEKMPPPESGSPPADNNFSRTWSSSSSEPPSSSPEAVPPADLPTTNNGLGEYAPPIMPVVVPRARRRVHPHP